MHDQISQRIRKSVQDELLLMGDIEDEQVLELIDERITDESHKSYIEFKEKKSLRKAIFNSIRRLDVLQDLMDDDSITEIMVNGTDDIFIEREGRLFNTGRRFESKERLYDIIQQIVAGANRTVNVSSPIADARLEDGSRVNVVLDPLAINGPILTIRRFYDTPIDEEKLLELGSVSAEVLNFLRIIVKAGYNILISGGTGSGKTTFLNVLSGYIPDHERIITIEDSAELKIRGIDNLVRLEARESNTSGSKSISIRDLIKTALRMRPDRIIVGEVRGGEAIDMLQAMNVGQDGSMSTIHANSAADALGRLETMIMLNNEIPLNALRRQIASGIDILIQLGRLRDNSRKLLEIREVTGMEGDNITTELLYEFKESGSKCDKVVGEYIKLEELRSDHKLKRAGIK